MRTTLLIALTLLVLHPVQALANQTLLGRLVVEDEQGALTAAAGILVARESGGNSLHTDTDGVFRFELQEPDRPGGTLRLIVYKDGWVIHHPLEGDVRVPADPDERVEVRLLPKGSGRLWTEDRIAGLIAELAVTTKGRVASSDDPEDLDFRDPIREWAEHYGFSPDEVGTRIDRWVREVERTDADPYRKGLVAVTRKQLGEADRLFAESAEFKAKRLERAMAAPNGNGPSLLEEAVRDYRLAGDCAYADYRFADALDRYRSALALLDHPERPRLGVLILHNLADAAYQLGIRAVGEDMRTRLTESVASLKAALDIQPRETVPVAWMQTQAMLLRVYEDLGDAAGMSAVLEELRSADPDNRDYYKLAHALSHEALFDFERAHRATAAWLEHYPDDMDAQCNLAETYFTTGSFEQSGRRLELLLESGRLPPDLEGAMRLLEIANLLALGETGKIPARVDALRGLLETQPEDFTIGWTFEGSSHFIGQEPTLEGHRAMLFGLLWAAETGKRDALLATLDKAVPGFSPTPKNGQSEAMPMR